MITKTIYIARDGEEFFSKKACLEHEKWLDEKERSGTIAEILYKLKQEKGYLWGIVWWIHDNQPFIHTFSTVNIEGSLSKYTDTSKLTEKEKYSIMTVEEAIKSISSKADEKDLCQYTLYISEKLDGSYGHLTYNYNNTLQDEITKLPQNQEKTCTHVDLHPYGW